MTDKLRSYGVAHRELIPETIHSTQQYENNRAEQSHETTRVARARDEAIQIGKAGSAISRLPMLPCPIYSILGRHLVSANHYRDLRVSAFGEWSKAVA